MNNRDWTFLYWEDDHGNIYKPGQELTLIEDLILTARWENTTNYQVVFKYNYNEKTKTYDNEKVLEDKYRVGDFYKTIDPPADIRGNLRGWIHDK